MTEAQMQDYITKVMRQRERQMRSEQIKRGLRRKKYLKKLFKQEGGDMRG